jgi:dihydroorotate dehydrogenase
MAYKYTNGKIPLIGVGGVDSAEQAYEKIKNGASLIQLYTGLVYNGPNLIKDINEDLSSLIERDGYKNISEAVGAEVN